MAVYLCKAETRTFPRRRWWQFWKWAQWAHLPRVDRPGEVAGTIVGLYRDRLAALRAADDLGLEDFVLEEAHVLHEANGVAQPSLLATA